MTVVQAALKVLREAKKPLHFRDIARIALAKRYWTTKGKTPHYTVASALYMDIRRKGKSSAFRHFPGGTFALHKHAAKTIRKKVVRGGRRIVGGRKGDQLDSPGIRKPLTGQLKKLQEHLKKRLPGMRGKWVTKTNAYDQEFANAINANYEKDNQRYWDCNWRGIRLEAKKSKAKFWLDLVRYSERLTAWSWAKSTPVITVFMVYKGNRIAEIYAVKENELIKKMKLSKKMAADLLQMKIILPRTFNAQQCLMVSDVRDIAEFSVHRRAR